MYSTSFVTLFENHQPFDLLFVALDALSIYGGIKMCSIELGRHIDAHLLKVYTYVFINVTSVANIIFS